MKVKASFSALREAKWYEYAERFAIGGAITVAAGIIAKLCGPKMGGLFLAFPAIFPLTATLIDKHQKQRKQRIGADGHARARAVVAVESAGTTLGTLALIVFAWTSSRLLANSELSIALLASTAAWLAVAVGAWWISEKI